MFLLLNRPFIHSKHKNSHKRIFVIHNEKYKNMIFKNDRNNYNVYLQRVLKFFQLLIKTDFNEKIHHYIFIMK